MDKKIISLIVAIICLCLIGGGTFFLFNNQKIEDDNNNSNEKSNNEHNSNNNEPNNPSNGQKEENTPNKKVLVVYYSATNNTKNVAEKIAKNLNGDIFEIVPANKYTSEDLDWTDNNSRVSKEHNDESLRDIKLVSTKVTNWNSYDTILIGYPIWWDIAAWPVNNFVKSNDFTGKTVIPFCTSSSSGLGESSEILKKMAKGGNWQEGHRFQSRPSDSDISSFTNSIK